MTALQQSPIFNDALALLGAAPERLELPNGHAFLLRRPWRPSLVTRGPTCHAALTAYKATRLRLLTPETEIDLRSMGYSRLVTPSTIAELHLGLPSAALRQQMKQKWRNRLTRAETLLHSHHHITHRAFNPAKDSWLLEKDAEQQRKKRYRSYPRALLLAMHAIAPEALHLFQLNAQETPCAAMLFINHAPTVTYHLGWSNPQGRRIGAHQLLLWRAMAHFSDNGAKTLDLGTLETETGAGLARFKLGSGAKPRQLGGTWIRVQRST